MLLQENDYGYIAQQLQFVANKFCNGRMVSVLEGGYNTNTGVISSFAQSVFYYIRYMNIGINMFQCYDVQLTKEKRKIKYDEEMELYNSISKPIVKPRRSERLKQMEENKENINEEIKNNNEENNIKEEDNKKNINSINNKEEKNIKINDNNDEEKYIQINDNKANINDNNKN